MTLQEFIESDGQFHRKALRALWLADKGQWEQAHEVAQAEDGLEGAWIHAYLHRVEGDTMNANYWYKRAGRPAASGELKTEWSAIVTELLNDSGSSKKLPHI